MPYNISNKIKKDFDVKIVLDVAKAISNSFSWRAKQIYVANDSPTQFNKTTLFGFGLFVQQMLNYSKNRMDDLHYEHVCNFKIYIHRVLSKSEEIKDEKQEN